MYLGSGVKLIQSMVNFNYSYMYLPVLLTRLQWALWINWSLSLVVTDLSVVGDLWVLANLSGLIYVLALTDLSGIWDLSKLSDV